MKVRFCENSKGRKKIANRLEEKFPDLDMKVKKCIGKCGACAEAAVAKVDGKILVGTDSEDLYVKIVKRLEEN